ncbi:MAG: efflux RND transporter periplasmic adaptor subunit [Armatimonadetes bacterium]|nr:efflux RND transporter periplasmic adaptor subunit [Armatimonadota bacterium]
MSVSTNYPERTLVFVAVVLAAVLTAGCGKKPPQSQSPTATAVEVAQVERGAIEDVIEVTGTVRALEDVTLSAKQGGKVTLVPFREGDRVTSGAVVVQQQREDLLNALESSKASASSAQTHLTQARTASQVQDVTSDTTLRQAQQALSVAQQRLAVVRQGARTQEVAQAQAAVEAARANASNAQTSLERTRKLYNQGAVARANLDADERAYDVAQANLRSAQQALSLTRAGARPEEVRQAELAVQQAREQVLQAQANLKQKELRQQDIRSAEAALQQARAGVAMAQQALADSSIRSPIRGVVAQRSVEPGQMVAPGSPLIRVYNPVTVYFEATIPEVSVAETKPGQFVSVRTDAVPGRRFHGKVVEIYPAADTANRSFKARVSVSDAGTDLKPGMFAKGDIEVERHQNALILPRDALVSTSDGQKVFRVVKAPVQRPKAGARPDGKGKVPMETVDGAVVRLRSVSTGLANGTRIEITEGLSDGDRVVRTGQAYLKDGQEVNIVDSSGEDTEAQAR